MPEGVLIRKADWQILELEVDIGRYFRRLFLKGHGIKLEAPSWREHITVISSWDAPLEQDFTGETIEFSIELQLWTNGNAFWYPVVSQRLNEIRFQQGLGEPLIPFHFCFGYRSANVL